MKKTNKLKNLFKENLENIKNNIIIAEIEIKGNLREKIINIDNIDKKMNEYCEIYVNNIKIGFNEYYNFPKNGVYSIKYKFHKLLSSTRGIFFICLAIQSLDLSSFNTQNVTNMSGMFNRCNSLINLNLSSFNTQNVTDMNGMFYECNSLIKKCIKFDE